MATRLRRAAALRAQRLAGAIARRLLLRGPITHARFAASTVPVVGAGSLPRSLKPRCAGHCARTPQPPRLPVMQANCAWVKAPVALSSR